jgi:hypothetical protein
MGADSSLFSAASVTEDKKVLNYFRQIEVGGV